MTRHTILLPGLALLVAASGCSPARGPRPVAGEIPVAAARRAALATTVTVRGVVTVPSGALDDGFAVQDRSGGVYVAAAKSPAHAPGEVVRVTGALVDDHGRLGLRPDSVRVTGRAALPAPRPVRTGAVGESTEGTLVRVRGRVVGGVVDDRPWGWKVTLDDGSGPLLVFVSAGTGIDAGGIRAGTRLEVDGFSGQYDDHHEVLPRSPADVRVLPE